ncbi:MAG: hypothetical protein HYR72_08455 [Deltaproteobacteria bacterium]|nr:hypothetical protein [Deltaproteobacteria bacterium]MBI3388784.1 hypothetical protein [Deltaproteobacteria bacterium]
MNDRQAQLLRAAFLAGAVTDALAVIPMLFPPMARLLWGFEDFGGPYRFAMGYGASLMAAWTALLVWAYQRPVERAFVAALTVFVIYGLAATEIVAVMSGVLPAWRMIPTWALQAILLCLFASAYHYPLLRRRVAA